MNQPKGYAGKGLRIDLASESYSEERIDSEVLKKYLGGAALGTKMLFDELSPQIEPFSSENKLIFVTGPLNGTLMPLAKGHVVVSKSPLTGTICKSSSGGLFGAEMKFAGYDFFVLEEKAADPIYVSINDDDVEIEDAEHLWGKTTHQTEDIIKGEENSESRSDNKSDYKVSSIGPAGENLVRFACIINEKHNAAGRGGLGAVMGSKNVKALAVKGSKDLNVHDVESLARLRGEMENYLEGTDFGESFSKYGTTSTVPVTNLHGIYPTKNFQEGVFEPFEDFDPEEIWENLVIREKGCFGCPIHCNKVVKISEDSADLVTDRQEFETYYALGGNCGNWEIERIIEAGDRCNRLGMDTISTGATISFALELAQRGIIEKEIDDLELEWGDTQTILSLIEKIARREGFGDLLAEGSARAANEIGQEAQKYSMSVKSMELPGYDPRGAKGIGLTYAVASRGACHKFAYTIRDEMWTGKADRFAEKGKAELVKELSDINAFLHSAIICTFPVDQDAFGLAEIADSLEFVTGIEYTEDELMRIGERAVNLQRIFNVREGFSSDDDTLPLRFLEEPMEEGPSKDETVELNEMLQEYYRLRGWEEDGIPREDKLSELGIST